MCGFSGIFSFNKNINQNQASVVKKMTDAIAITGCKNSWEATIPTTVVKITSLMTLGFINSKKSLKSALG